MRTATILLFTCVFISVAETGYTQSAKVTLNKNKVNLKEVLNEIENQTDYLFIYNDEVNTNKTVSVRTKNGTVSKVLTHVLKDSDIDFMMEGNHIILSYIEARKKEEAKEKEVIEAVKQQRKTVAGNITDFNGEPIIGANIIEKGTSNGTVTDYDGNFSLNVSNNAVLRVSYIGYLEQEVATQGKNTINVKLQEDTKTLDEVIVVGYGTQKKVNLTGSIDVITEDQIKERPVSNVIEALQGASPNLNISPGEFSNEPGGGMSFNIRGVGSLSGDYSPYVLIDGMPMDINSVNPSDIASISVLKDAAASAIYGARAPYGVILITTKKGQQGEKVKVTYNNNTSLSSPIGMPHMENTLKYFTAHNQANENVGLPPEFTEYEFERARKYMAGEIKEETWLLDDGSDWHGNNIWDIAGNANNDWFHDVYYKKNVLRQKHDASISGGTNNSSYYASVGYLDQPGELRYGDEHFKRYNITTNLTAKPVDWITLNINSKYIKDQKQYFNPGDYDRRTHYHNFFRTNVFRPLYLPNGTFSSISYIPPMVDENAISRTNGSAFLTTMGISLEPIKNWKTDFNYHYKVNNLRSTDNRPTTYGENPSGEKVVYGNPISYYSTSSSENMYSMFNITSSYAFNLKDHNFFVMGGFERENNDYNYLQGRKNEVLVASVPSISTAVGEHYLNDALSHWANAGFFGRIQYNYDEKYLFEANFRRDGSSRFEESTRWGFFPSFSVGYNVHRESFWESIEPYINSFKIRASWGSLGNQNVPNYLYLPTLGIHTNLEWIMGSERPSYTTAPRLVSADLTWETSTTSNIGFDMGFLRNRLNASLDIYSRKTTDMFGPSEALPRLLGTSVPQSNNATLKTKGFELVLSWRDNVTEDFSYNIKATLSDNVSTVEKFNNPTKTLSTWYEGQKVGEIWGLETVGIYQTDEAAAAGPDQSYYYPTWGAGDMQYKDINGDNKIDIGKYTVDDSGDLKIIGNNSPRFMTGVSIGAQWKGFDASMLWQGVLKRDFSIPGGNAAFHGFNGPAWWDMNMFYKGKDTTLDYWRPKDETNMLGPNTDAYYPKPYLSNEDSKNRQAQSHFTQNASYLRLKNLTIGYTLPNSLLEKAQISNARIYLSGENLLTFTPLSKLIDPELLVSGYGNQIGKAHFLRSVYSVGLSITF